MNNMETEIIKSLSDSVEDIHPSDNIKGKIFSGLEKRSILKNKNHGLKIKFATAVLVVVVLTFISNLSGNNVLGKINKLGTSIEEFLNHKDNSLQDYKTIINKSVTNNGITAQLNEFMIDEDEIIISSTFNSSKVELSARASVGPQIYINGKDIMVDGFVGSSEVNPINFSTLSFFNKVMPKDNKFMKLTGDIHVKVVYDRIRTENKTISGNWVFEFTTNKDKLSETIKKIPINKSFTVNPGPKITVSDLSVSPVGMKLKYTISDSLNYIINFILSDEKGNQIPSISGAGGSYSEANPEANGVWNYDIIDKSITKLKITPVLKAIKKTKSGSHEETVDYTKVLEENSFEINIK